MVARTLTCQAVPKNPAQLATRASKNGGVCAPMEEPQMGTGRFAFENGQGTVFSSMSAAFSPIMIDGALVLPDVSVGMIEASATRRPAMP